MTWPGYKAQHAPLFSSFHVLSTSRLSRAAPVCLTPKSRGISAIQCITLSCPDQEGSWTPTIRPAQVQRKGHFGWRCATQWGRFPAMAWSCTPSMLPAWTSNAPQKASREEQNLWDSLYSHEQYNSLTLHHQGKKAPVSCLPASRLCQEKNTDLSRRDLLLFH